MITFIVVDPVLNIRHTKGGVPSRGDSQLHTFRLPTRWHEAEGDIRTMSQMTHSDLTGRPNHPKCRNFLFQNIGVRKTRTHDPATWDISVV